jgi:HAD superfamily hydrolase (TIGR01509 family)
VHRKEQLYLSMIEQVRPIASVVAHITAQHGQIPMAVVSGSPRLTVESTLKALHLGHCFDAIVAAEDYAHGKPDPEPFLTAARQLNVPPAACLVFEDAEAGIESAQAAGMAWVRVPVHHLATAVAALTPQATPV